MVGKKSFCLLIVLGLIAFLCAASRDSLTEISFSDLMNVEVSVASKKEESIFDAPGIVTSYSFSDMENLGYFTLKELAQVTPGYSVTSLYGEHGFETRGAKTSSFNNNRHLVLWDGIPINHGRANKAPTGEELSLFGAKRVEFLRGPASALYGTGAYYGVVNIVPFLPAISGTELRSRVVMGAGLPERRSDLALGHRGSKANYYAALSYYQNEASKLSVGSSAQEHYKLWDDTKAVSFQGSYTISDGPLEGLGAGTVYLSRSSGLGEHWNEDFSHEMNDIKWETFVTYLRYRRELTDLLSIDSYIKHNRSTETGWFTPLGLSSFLNFSENGGDLMYNYEVPIKQYSYYLEFDYSRSNWGVIGGLELDMKYQADDSDGAAFYFITTTEKEPYQIEENALIRSEDFLQSSFFLQGKGELSVLKGMLLTGGIRADLGKAGENSFQQLSPRLALVQRFTDFLNLKLLYGTALLAPGIKEVMLNEELIHNSPLIGAQLSDLEAETFSTFEGGLHFHNEIKSERNILHMGAEIAAFNNRSLNEIKDVKFTADSPDSLGNTKTENAFTNIDDTVTAYGVEVALHAELDFGIGLWGNYSYAKAENRMEEHPSDIPFHKVRGGVYYRSQRLGLYSSISGRYVHEFSASDNTYINGYSVADFNLGWHSTVGIGAEVHIANLLDSQKLYPVGGKPLIPLDSRQVRLALTARF